MEEYKTVLKQRIDDLFVDKFGTDREFIDSCTSGLVPRGAGVLDFQACLGAYKNWAELYTLIQYFNEHFEDAEVVAYEYIVRKSVERMEKMLFKMMKM